MNNKKNIEKSLRWDCRYYNGEKLNPYEEELKKHRVDNSHLSPPDCMHDEYDIPSDEVEKLQGVIGTGAIDPVLQVCLALASSSFLRCGYCCPKCHEINRGRVWVGLKRHTLPNTLPT